MTHRFPALIAAPAPAEERLWLTGARLFDGTGGALRTGFLQRCPGGAISPPRDHSAPFVDSGPLSNPHCKASESIGGTP